MLFVFFISSCTGPQSTAPAPPSPPTDAAADQSEEITRQSRILSRLTDEILLALATYNYPRLEGLINAKELQLSGAEAAVRLMGPRALTMILGPWDAQEIAVSLDDNLRQATAAVEVSYRLSLNRELQTALFTFNFHRSNMQDAWQMVIK